MPVALKPKIVDALLLGQGDRRRQLQELPILADVWALYAERPGRAHDLLLAPRFGVTAARLAAFLDPADPESARSAHDRQVAYLHGIVAARLPLPDLWTEVLPATIWWRRIARDAQRPLDRLAATLEADVRALLDIEIDRETAIGSSTVFDADLRAREQAAAARPSDERQLIRLALLIGCLAAADEQGDEPPIGRLVEARDRLGAGRIARLGHDALTATARRFDDAADDDTCSLVFNVSLNRQADYATVKSVPAIKADAARQLFSISCADIGWAVIDSGIDAAHPAFAIRRATTATPGEQLADTAREAADPPPSRVKAIYDFSAIRAILSRTNLYNQAVLKRLVDDLAGKAPGVADIESRVRRLATAASEDRPVDWALAEPLLRRGPDDEPTNPHGTHVAAILGGDWVEREEVRQQGVCPDIRLYDLRVLGTDAEQSEFAVIAALQFVRYLNARGGSAVIDGVNLSLSIPHNVRNYACGKTPVCVEAEALAAAGTVVVAAAGNRGYQSFQLADGTCFESYAASTITDPGNADGVITVGSTHRFWPHTYGVSFFSGRGPTGDGRMKPDILAPGERIESAVPGPATDAMDGTSMAAPHVSGAAALLMGRHRELRGRPAKIKEVLCATATDLGRERSFQGHGMVDVLRAIQSI